MIKAIITDLDRTLLHDDKSVSDITVETLLECKNRGIPVIAATARPIRTVAPYDEKIGFDAMVTTNGAVVTVHGKVFNFLLEKDEVVNILTALQKLEGCVISMETTHGFYANVDIPIWSPVVVSDLLTVPRLDEVFKILVSSETVNLNERIPGMIGKEVYYSVAANVLFQIMSKKATKWNGIKTVLESYGIDPSEAVYFGDDNDDIESVRNCGTGVAVSNSIPEVKAVADVVIESNELDGVAGFIRKEILK